MKNGVLHQFRREIQDSTDLPNVLANLIVQYIDPEVLCNGQSSSLNANHNKSLDNDHMYVWFSRSMDCAKVLCCDSCISRCSVCNSSLDYLCSACAKRCKKCNVVLCYCCLIECDNCLNGILCSNCEKECFGCDKVFGCSDDCDASNGALCNTCLPQSRCCTECGVDTVKWAYLPRSQMYLCSECLDNAIESIIEQ